MMCRAMPRPSRQPVLSHWTPPIPPPLPRGPRISLAIALATNYVWTFTTSTTACTGISTVPMGSACSFGVLGGSTVTNSGVSTFVTGDIGVWPGSAITGFTPSNYSGTEYAGDAAAQTAQGDLTTAYNFAAAAAGGAVLPADIGGETLAPGVYKTTSAQPSLE